MNDIFELLKLIIIGFSVGFPMAILISPIFDAFFD